MDSECGAVHVQVQAGMQLFSNSPCLFSTNLGAIEASATGVSVSPSVVNLGSTAINVAPQAISISPVRPNPSCSHTSQQGVLCDMSKKPIIWLGHTGLEC